MKTVELRKASKSLANYTAELNSEALVITSGGEPVAALVSVKGMDQESLALSLSPEFANIIRRARSEAKKGHVFSLKDVKEEMLEESVSPPRSRHVASKHPQKTPNRKK